MNTELTDKEFNLFQKLAFSIAGLNLTEKKKALVAHRLFRRIRQLDLSSYLEYYNIIINDDQHEEEQIMLDLLTTNETFFFREMDHFEFLKKMIINGHNMKSKFRIWSAACSTGEEPYSIAMTLSEYLPANKWEILASDVSAGVLERARTAIYPEQRLKDISPHFIKKYCLRGVRQQEGRFKITKEIKKSVTFKQINLHERIDYEQPFDVIFLRNVMIYFNRETKNAVVKKLCPLLKNSGYFFIGHAESLHGVTDKLKMIQPAVYQMV